MLESGTSCWEPRELSTSHVAFCLHVYHKSRAYVHAPGPVPAETGSISTPTHISWERELFCPSLWATGDSAQGDGPGGPTWLPKAQACEQSRRRESAEKEGHCMDLADRPPDVSALSSHPLEVVFSESWAWPQSFWLLSMPQDTVSHFAKRTSAKSSVSSRDCREMRPVLLTWEEGEMNLPSCSHPARGMATPRYVGQLL